VKNRISTAAQVETKRGWMDWRNPLPFVLFIVAVVVPVALAIEAFRRLAWELEAVRRHGGIICFVLVFLTALASAVFNLMYQPLSRINPMFRRKDVVNGVILICLAAGMLVLFGWKSL